MTAHFYSAAHGSNLNTSFAEAYQKEAKARANFMVVSGYDGMHLIYEALTKTAGSTDGKTLVAAMKGMSWESPRGPMSIDRDSGEVVHNIYIRKVEKVDGELRNVEFETFGNIKDPQNEQTANCCRGRRHRRAQPRAQPTPGWNSGSRL